MKDFIILGLIYATLTKSDVQYYAMNLQSNAMSLPLLGPMCLIQGGEGGKLGGAILQRHLRMLVGSVMGEIHNLLIFLFHVQI